MQNTCGFINESKIQNDSIVFLLDIVKDQINKTQLTYKVHKGYCLLEGEWIIENKNNK